jgi:hypothetical protein
MSGFAHLCPECLDVPTTQCGYRACPQRALQTAAVTSFRPEIQGHWQGTPPVDTAARTVAYAGPAIQVAEPGRPLAAGGNPSTGTQAAAETASLPIKPQRRALEDQQ